jgi:LPXTG-motif cell wall-anchored protein
VRKLAYTGADIGSMLGLAIALLVSGATLVGLAMWKRREV